MKKSLKKKATKMELLEKATATFWSIQQQWHGIGEEALTLTTSQAIRKLGVIKDTPSYPRALRCAVAILQKEIIYNTRPKKSKSNSLPICSVISIR